jgi:hypothetical protein
MSADFEPSPWICHVCGHTSTVGEGIACDQCYKIACRRHLVVASIYNPDSGLYELKQICVDCQLRKQLN